MTTPNFKLLGQNDTIRARRFQILQLYLKNMTPPEMAESLDLTTKQIYKDLEFLRSQQLNDLPLEIIKDLGTNFFEMKVRELGADARAERLKEKPDHHYISNIEKLILSNKVESLKLQGAYQDPESAPTGPIQIIFTEVGPDFGKDTAKLKPRGEGKAQETARGQDGEQEEAPDDIREADDPDPEKEYPLY